MKKLIPKKEFPPEPRLIRMGDYEGSAWKVWQCDQCKVLFEPDDMVMLLEKDLLCPLYVGLFKAKRCLTSLSYADMEYWNKHYIITNL